jgi:hypothetical protein
MSSRLTFNETRPEPAKYLAERGWTTRNRNLADLFRTVGRPASADGEFPDHAQYLLYLSGVRN